MEIALGGDRRGAQLRHAAGDGGISGLIADYRTRGARP
jgi:hypothetical protein